MWDDVEVANTTFDSKDFHIGEIISLFLLLHLLFYIDSLSLDLWLQRERHFRNFAFFQLKH